MIKSTTIIIAFLFFIACNETPKKKANSEKDTSIPIIINTAQERFVSGCYQMLIKEDTVELELNTDGKTVTGHLSYNWKERDDNEGTITGIIKDSLLLADYTFNSEGVTSVREVMFKKRGDTIFQGYGELLTGKDTLRFKYPEMVIFDHKNPFLPVDCDK